MSKGPTPPALKGTRPEYMHTYTDKIWNSFTEQWEEHEIQVYSPDPDLERTSNPAFAFGSN